MREKGQTSIKDILPSKSFPDIQRVYDYISGNFFDPALTCADREAILLWLASGMTGSDYPEKKGATLMEAMIEIMGVIGDVCPEAGDGE